MAAQQPQAGAHHQRIGLAAEIGLLAGGHFHRRNQRPAGRGNTLVDIAGYIGIGTDELGPAQHQIHRPGQGVQRIGPPLTDHHIVRVHIVHGDACIVQGIQKSRLANDKGRAPWGLGLEEGRRCKSTGIKMLLRHIQPHPGKLLPQLFGGHAAVVGQEQIFLVLPLQPLDKFRSPRQDPVPMVQNTIHIANKALLGLKINLHSSFSPLTLYDNSSISRFCKVAKNACVKYL